MIAFSGPGAVFLSGAGLVAQAPTLESPLPGGVASVVRFLLGLPPWFQIAGLVVGVLAAAVVLVLVWRRRQQIATWVSGRSRGIRIAIVAAAIGVVFFAAGFGAVSWNYVQHDNDFCTGCHVMDASFTRFTQSEHSTLSCHDCHQQSMFASMRQLYLWVAERPAEIGPHARVPNAVCAQCHVTGEREVWQRIASTAGHRTHLESSNPKLANVQCVDCHGVEVHHFAPLDRTCAQSGCHEMSQIALGEMRDQTVLHCTMCHQFTAEVPTRATRDSAAGTLTPGARECFSCHAMQERLAGMNMDPARDPHVGSCGMCHNPHRQETPAAARATCTTAGCHADWRSEPFHVGATHGRLAAQCTTCHLPHQAKVDASDCAGCHASVRERGRRPPMPFDTTRARRGAEVSALWHDEWSEPTRRGPSPPSRDPPGLELPAASFSTPIALDTFSHDRHRALACITCHTTTDPKRRLTFTPPRGCQACHHASPAKAACGTCHGREELPGTLTLPVQVAVAGHTPRARDVTFSHTAHESQRCVACHTTPVTLEADAAKGGGCASCHHAEGRACSACHEAAQPRAAHPDLGDGHVACSSCHQEAVVAQLMPGRSFCLTCHAQQRDHFAGRGGECTTCHFLRTPDEFRKHLLTAEDDA